MTVLQRRSAWPRVHLAMGLVVAVAVDLAADRYAHYRGRGLPKGPAAGPLRGARPRPRHDARLRPRDADSRPGYAQSPRFQVLRDSPWFAALFGVFTAALRVLALAFAAALTGLLFDHNDPPLAVLTALAAGSTVAALARVVHLLSVLEKVVRVVTSDPSRPPGG